MIHYVYSSVLSIGLIALILTIFEIVAFNTFINKNLTQAIQHMENIIIDNIVYTILPWKTKYGRQRALTIDGKIKDYKKIFKEIYLKHKDEMSKKPDNFLYIRTSAMCDLLRYKTLIKNRENSINTIPIIFSDKINKLLKICDNNNSDDIFFFMKNKIKDNLELWREVTIQLKDMGVATLGFTDYLTTIYNKIGELNKKHNLEEYKIKINSKYIKFFKEASVSGAMDDVVIKKYFPNEYANDNYMELINDIDTTVKNGINKFETDYNSEVIDEMYNTMMDTLDKNRYRYTTYNIIPILPMHFYNKFEDFAKILESNENYYIKLINNKYIYINSVFIILIVSFFTFIIYHLIKVYQLKNYIRSFLKAIDKNIIFSIIITIVLIILFQIYFFFFVMTKYKSNSSDFANIINYVNKKILDEDSSNNDHAIFLESLKKQTITSIQSTINEEIKLYKSKHMNNKYLNFLNNNNNKQV